MTRNIPAKLGILMLDTRFPRIPGDVGNPDTWGFPVEYRVVKGATPRAVVFEDTTPLADAFVAQAKQLVANGCSGIATSCGFLALIRPHLTARIGVPVATSALEQAPQIAAMLSPEQTLGILTISETSLTRAHLDAAGVPAGAVIAGVENTGFGRSILGDLPDLDVQAARAEMVDAASQMVRRAPQIGAILLECTNMPPYAAEIRAATGRPVFSIVTYLNWFHAGLAPRDFIGD